MDNQQLEQQKNVALIHTLRTQSYQGEALAAALERVTGIEERMAQVVVTIDQRMLVLQEQIDKSMMMNESLAKEITINYDQQKNIQGIVSSISNNFTKEHQRKLEKIFSANMFKAYKGLFIRRIYAKLKNEMNVVRYTAVKKLDYQETIAFLKELTYSSFTDKELEPTPAILKLMELERGLND